MEEISRRTVFRPFTGEIPQSHTVIDSKHINPGGIAAITLAAALLILALWVEKRGRAAAATKTDKGSMKKLAVSVPAKIKPAEAQKDTTAFVPKMQVITVGAKSPTEETASPEPKKPLPTKQDKLKKPWYWVYEGGGTFFSSEVRIFRRNEKLYARDLLEGTEVIITEEEARRMEAECEYRDVEYRIDRGSSIEYTEPENYAVDRLAKEGGCVQLSNHGGPQYYTWKNGIWPPPEAYRPEQHIQTASAPRQTTPQTQMSVSSEKRTASAQASALVQKSKGQATGEIRTAMPSSPQADTGGKEAHWSERLLTSQLAAMWQDTGAERYRDEYMRRLRLCGLSDNTAKEMLSFETDMLQHHPRPELLKKDFISERLFSLAQPFLQEPLSYYETNYVYPFSYVIKLSDEAEWHFWNSHEKDLADPVWAEIFALSDRNRKLFLPFATHLVEHMGWTVANVNKFSFHEQGMLDRYRWGKKHSAASNDPWEMNK